MSENVSTQLPNPPELQPLPSHRPKGWQLASSALIVFGLIFLAWGGWLYYQNWLATTYPPARILEVSVTALESPTATPTVVKPTPTVKKNDTETLAVKPTNSPTATPTMISPPTAPLPEPSPTATPVIEPAIATAFPTNEAPPTTAATAIPSLEENPLLVQPTVETPAPEIDPVPESAALVEVAPAPSTPLTRIVAESVNLDTPIVPVGWKQTVHNGQPINVWTVADYAAGWHQNSMLPGQGGNIVLSGHHNIKGEVFRYIVDLEPGATISLYQNEQRFDYAVVDKFIVKDKGEPDAVRRENAKWIGPFNDERLTLVTCWPYTNNTHRVIVIAKPVGDGETGD